MAAVNLICPQSGHTCKHVMTAYQFDPEGEFSDEESANRLICFEHGCAVCGGKKNDESLRVCDDCMDDLCCIEGCSELYGSNHGWNQKDAQALRGKKIPVDLKKHSLCFCSKHYKQYACKIREYYGKRW